MTDRDLETLYSNLRVCSEHLIRGEYKVKVKDKDEPLLRVLQSDLKEMFTRSTDGRVRALAYILYTWIDKCYVHFAGAVPPAISDEIAKVRHELLSKGIAGAFAQIGNAKEGSANELWLGVEMMVVAYLDALGKVAEIAEASA